MLVVVDTLRADRLGSYGNQRGLTPFLDELASKAHVFQRAYAQAPWTLPSVASLLTSRYVSQHGVEAFDSVLSADERTLAEVFREAGYATAGFSANLLLSRNAGFDQGFDAYRVHMDRGDPAARRPEKRAGEITLEALVWLDEVRSDGAVEKPVFLYLHYMEPHLPYAPRQEMLERVRGTRPHLDLARVNEDIVAAHLDTPEPETLEGIRDAYDAEVMTIDAELRALADALAEREMLDSSILVVTADHGQEFQDHGGIGHGRTLYDEVLRVPLILRTPGQTRGVVVDRLVSSIDLAPTLLEVAGFETPVRFEGVSFARDLQRPGAGPALRRWLERRRDDRPEPAVFSELPLRGIAEANPIHESALVTGRRKLILSPDGTPTIYSLDVDPGEQRPNEVAEDERERLTIRWTEMQQRSSRSPTRRDTREIDADTHGMLRALGYGD